MIKIDGLQSPFIFYDSFLEIDTETLILEGKMNESCSDLIFVDASGQVLDFFIETGCNTTNTHVFIRHPISANLEYKSHVYALFGKNETVAPFTYNWGNSDNRAKFAFLSSLPTCPNPLIRLPSGFSNKHIRISNLVNHSTSIGTGHSHSCDNNHKLNINQLQDDTTEVVEGGFVYGNEKYFSPEAMFQVSGKGYCISGYTPSKQQLVVDSLNFYCYGSSPPITVAVYVGGNEGDVTNARLVESRALTCPGSEGWKNDVVSTPSTTFQSGDLTWLCFYADGPYAHWDTVCTAPTCDFLNQGNTLIDVSTMVSGGFPESFGSSGSIAGSKWPEAFFLMYIEASDVSVVNSATDFHNLTCKDGATDRSTPQYIRPSIEKNMCHEQFDEDFLLDSVSTGTLMMYDVIPTVIPNGFKSADDINVDERFPIFGNNVGKVWDDFSHTHLIMYDNVSSISESPNPQNSLKVDGYGVTNSDVALKHKHFNLHLFTTCYTSNETELLPDFPMRKHFYFVESTNDDARFHPGMITFAYCRDCAFEQSLTIVPPGWEFKEINGDWVGSYIAGSDKPNNVGRIFNPSSSLSSHVHNVEDCLSVMVFPIDNFAPYNVDLGNPVSVTSKVHKHPNSGTIKEFKPQNSKIDDQFPYFSAILMQRKDPQTTVTIVGQDIPSRMACEVLNSTTRSDSGEILWGIMCNCSGEFIDGMYCEDTTVYDTTEEDTVADTIQDEDTSAQIIDPIIIVTIVATSAPVALFIIIGAIAACIIVAVCCFGVGGIAAGGTLAKRKIDKMREGLKGIEMKVVDDEITQRHLTGKITKNLSPELRDDIIRICKEHAFKIFPYEDINLTHYITSGASGNIFKCQVKSIPNEEVVFKSYVIDIDVKEFEREIVIFGTTANHPNFLKLHGACLEKNHLGLIVTFGFYGDLGQFIVSSDKMSFHFKERCRILMEISDGFAFLHERGFIHRDIKPKNIVIDKSVTPKILDFGISTKRGRDRNSKRVGTLKYIAPECYRGSLYNEKVDIFSFGMTAYEVFTANFQPFGNEETCGISNQKMAESPSYRPDLTMIEHDSISSLISKMLAHDPEKRPSFENIKKKIQKIHSNAKDPLLIRLVTSKEKSSKGDEFLLGDKKFETLNKLIREKWKKCGRVGNVLIVRKRGNKVIGNDDDMIKTKDDDVFICKVADEELTEDV